MSNSTLDNFNRLTPEKQEELIVLIQKFQSYYQQAFVDMHQDADIAE